MMGPDVKILQKALGVKIDGTFGLLTQKKLKQYQKENDLQVDGICGPKSMKSLDICDEILAAQEDMKVDTSEMKQPVDYKQYDSRWGSIMYSNHGDRKQTIKSSGCGPTSGADIIATKSDADITPEDTCEWSVDWGCRTYSDGTSGSFFTKLARKYDYSIEATASIEDVKDCLINDGIVVVNFGTGSSNLPWYKKWTSGGHYCVIYSWDGFQFLVNDPASGKAYRKSCYPYELKNCRKRFYLFTFIE